jgi:hypothetical protein
VSTRSPDQVAANEPTSAVEGASPLPTPVSKGQRHIGVQERSLITRVSKSGILQAGEEVEAAGVLNKRNFPFFLPFMIVLQRSAVMVVTNRRVLFAPWSFASNTSLSKKLQRALAVDRPVDLSIDKHGGVHLPSQVAAFYGQPRAWYSGAGSLSDAALRLATTPPV